MKIAVYYNLPSGGAKRSIHEWLKRAVKQHQVDVYTLSSADHDYLDLRPLAHTHKIFPFTPSRRIPSPFGRLNAGMYVIDLLRLRKVQRVIAAEIDRDQYDVVFAHPDRYTNSPGLLRYLHTPSVYYCQDPLRRVYDPPIERPYNRRTLIARLLNRVDGIDFTYRTFLKLEDRRNLLAADSVLTNSSFTAETVWRTCGLRPEVCYLGVDTEVFRPLLLPREKFVLSAGSITPAKGFDFIIRSLALIPDHIRPRFVIVGNFQIKAECEYLQSIARHAQVELEIVTAVDDQSLVQMYNRAALTVYAPILEPFGLVPLESMACGTPVIGLAEGGVRESIRPNMTGWLTEREPQAFAAMIQNGLKHAKQWQVISEQGLAESKRQWQWERCVDQVEAELQRIAKIIATE